MDRIKEGVARYVWIIILNAKTYPAATIRKHKIKSIK